MGEKINAYRLWAEEPEGRRPLGTPRCRWNDDIKMDLKEEACDGVEWIDMTQGKDKWWTVVKAVMNLWVP